MIDVKLLIMIQIRDTPGVRYRELMRLTGLSNGVLEYHLRILEKSDRIKVDRLEGKRARYYSIDIPTDESHILGFIRNNVSRQIVTFILQHELCTFDEILEHIKKAPSTSSWHLKRLSKAAIISVTYGKRYQLYQVLDSKFVEEILYKYEESLENKLQTDVMRYLKGFNTIKDGLLKISILR
ncbi:MAG: winged helix-turn-helix transcriptional regulator [Candidatus Nitrosopolaris sp.]